MQFQTTFITGIVILLFSVLVITYLLIRVYKFLIKSKNVFGDRLETRLIGLALSSIFFPQGVAAVFIKPFQLLFGILVDFYYGISQLARLNNPSDSDLSGSFSDLLSRLIVNLYSNIQFYAVGTGILALAFWSLTGQMINSFVNAEKDNEAKSAILPNFVRQNLILGLIFMLSIYLCFAAIITVPYFTENDKIEVSKDLLKSKLDNIRESFKNSAFAITANSPVNNIDSTIPAMLAKIKNNILKEKINRYYASIKESYTNNIATRKTSESTLQEISHSLSKDLNELYSDLQGKYQVEEISLKSKQKITYINALADYYNDRAKSKIERANNVLKIVENGDGLLNMALNNFSTDYKILINQAIVADSANMNPGNFIVDYNLRLSMRNYYDELNFANYNAGLKYLDEPPPPPTPGEELGIFKNISQWLIKPHSMSLVLIVGMLGFGLFGAGISTFVKESKIKTASGVLVSDITGILIKGVSAAIVIFLAVKGGLAVFSSGDSEPNPYALFFTCLIGAVYSDRIWDWAQNKLTENFGDTGKEDNTITPKDE